MVDLNKFKEQEALGLPYKVHVYGKNVLITEAMKNYILDKLGKIERFHSHVIDIHAYLDIQKIEHSCSIVMKFIPFKIKVSAASNDMYVSIDEAVKKLEAKIRRWKTKIQDHSQKHLSEIDMRVNVLRRPYSEVDEINAEMEEIERMKKVKGLELPKVVGNETRPLKTLRPDEAIMKMELSDDHFLIFRDEVDRKIKVIYRRSDGDYGLILPE